MSDFEKFLSPHLQVSDDELMREEAKLDQEIRLEAQQDLRRATAKLEGLKKIVNQCLQDSKDPSKKEAAISRAKQAKLQGQAIQSQIDELKKTLAQPQAKQRSRGTSSAPAGAGDSLDAEYAALGDSDVDDGGDDVDDDDLGDLDDDDDMDEETKNLLKASSNLMKTYKKPPPGAGKKGASDDGLDAELEALEDDDDLDDDDDEDDDPEIREMTRNAKLLLQQHQGGPAKKEALSASQPAATGEQRQPNAGASDALLVENLRLKYALAAQTHTTNNDQVKAAACHEIAKKLDLMISDLQRGRPVDLRKLPPAPEEVKAAASAHEAEYRRLIDSVSEQVQDCHDLSERFKQQGDVEHSRLMQGQLKKFERDLTYLRTKHKANHPPPTFSTRELKIPIKALNLAIAQDHLRLEVIRCLGLPPPSGVKDRDLCPIVRATLDYPRNGEQAHTLGGGLKGCSGEFTSKRTKEFLINKSFARSAKRCSMKIEVLHISTSLMGLRSVEVPVAEGKIDLEKLLTEYEIHESITLHAPGRAKKSLDAKIEIKLHVRRPLEGDKVIALERHWILIDTHDKEATEQGPLAAMADAAQSKMDGLDKINEAAAEKRDKRQTQRAHDRLKLPTIAEVWSTTILTEMLRGLDGSKARAASNPRATQMVMKQQRQIESRLATIKGTLSTPAGRVEFIRHLLSEEKLYKDLCIEARAASNSSVMQNSVARYKAVKTDLQFMQSRDPTTYQSVLKGAPAANATGPAPAPEPQSAAAAGAQSTPAGASRPVAAAAPRPAVTGGAPKVSLPEDSQINSYEIIKAILATIGQEIMPYMAEMMTGQVPPEIQGFVQRRNIVAKRLKKIEADMAAAAEANPVEGFKKYLRILVRDKAYYIDIYTQMSKAKHQDTAMMKVYIKTMDEEINALRVGLEQEGVEFDSNGIPLEA